jgi:protein-tyrosine phosphatase
MSDPYIPVFRIGALPLAVVGRPPGGDALAPSLRALRSMGFAILVSALEAREARAFGLGEELREARAAGLRFVSIPIPDNGTRDPRPIRRTLARLQGDLAAGHGVAVHCAHGLGRSPMLVATLVAMGGVAIDDAWRAVQEARGQPVPGFDAQRAWVAIAMAAMDDLGRPTRLK